MNCYIETFLKMRTNIFSIKKIFLLTIASFYFCGTIYILFSNFFIAFQTFHILYNAPETFEVKEYLIQLYSINTVEYKNKTFVGNFIPKWQEGLFIRLFCNDKFNDDLREFQKNIMNITNKKNEKEIEKIKKMFNHKYILNTNIEDENDNSEKTKNIIALYNGFHKKISHSLLNTQKTITEKKYYIITNPNMLLYFYKKISNDFQRELDYSMKQIENIKNSVKKEQKTIVNIEKDDTIYKIIKKSIHTVYHIITQGHLYINEKLRRLIENMNEYKNKIYNNFKIIEEEIKRSLYKIKNNVEIARKYVSKYQHNINFVMNQFNILYWNILGFLFSIRSTWNSIFYLRNKLNE